jgi:SET domain-containing protein
MVAIAHGNRWHTLYVASADIEVGDELFISYGSNYWKNREFF